MLEACYEDMKQEDYTEMQQQRILIAINNLVEVHREIEVSVH